MRPMLPPLLKMYAAIIQIILLSKRVPGTEYPRRDTLLLCRFPFAEKLVILYSADSDTLHGGENFNIYPIIADKRARTYTYTFLFTYSNVNLV